ncbi:AraC-type DNA-binding protein [Bosea sp. OK403]|uniref:AraC family transcriptional regulator n=1 Tax=Bosea sp. OK403 TaxID=1855286 RepID=UPI0008E9B00C|nr:AraC family transcriptional regulator [Bosea sp. OK403]SFJ18021.1 AraC-type DNA-binding protein [Bosea sp. OK403]
MARIDPLNVAHYWRDHRLDGLSLMRADFQTQHYAPHRHEAFVIAATEFGGSVVRSRGLVEQANASTLLAFNPAEPHSGGMGASRRWRYRSLYLEQAAIDEVARGLGIDAVPYFTRNLFADLDLISRFLLLHGVLQDGRDVLQANELMISTFAMLFARYGSGGGRIEPAPRDRVRLKTALEMIRARLNEALSLSDLSQVLALTQYQVISLFKRTTGLTPHVYVTQLRLDVACRRLAQGAGIADVAVDCGFYDQSALTRHFKRCYGLTPLQFATAARS